jgi:hypothetical protein
MNNLRSGTKLTLAFLIVTSSFALGRERRSMSAPR